MTAGSENGANVMSTIGNKTENTNSCQSRYTVGLFLYVKLSEMWLESCWLTTFLANAV